MLIDIIPTSQDGIELIDAAYAVFVQGAEDEELKSYIFELRTKAMMYLDPARVADYIKIIFEKDGLQISQAVMEYIVIVLGQFLQIMVIEIILQLLILLN